MSAQTPKGDDHEDWRTALVEAVANDNCTRRGREIGPKAFYTVAAVAAYSAVLWVVLAVWLP